MSSRPAHIDASVRSGEASSPAACEDAVLRYSLGAPSDRVPSSLDVVVHRGVAYTTQIPIRRDGTFDVGDMASQAYLTLSNLKVQLEAVGSGLDRILHLTAYLTDMSDWPAWDEVYRRMLPQPYTVRCTVGVAALALDGMRVEISAIAATREGHETKDQAR